MAEQFSEEYISLIKSEEMAWLQGLWKPAAGDWIVWIDDEYDEKWHIDCLGTDEYTEPTKAISDLKEYGPVLWLPTLGQLVRLILAEGCGYELGYDIEGEEHFGEAWKPQASIKDRYLCDEAGHVFGNDETTTALRLLAAVREETDDA